MKLLICGSRSLNSQIHFEDLLSVVSELKKLYDIEYIISGMAWKGADVHAIGVCQLLDIPLLEFPADWDSHGISAGFIRNKEMVDIADITIAVHDNVSSGTRDSIVKSKNKGVPVYVLKYYQDALVKLKIYNEKVHTRLEF